MMAATVFYFLINMSISGSLVIIILLLLRQIPVIPKRVIYPLWFLAFIRLSLPFALSSSISIFNFFGAWIKKVVPLGSLPLTDITAANYFNAASSYAPMVYKTESLSGIFHRSTMIWGAGAFAALIIIAVLYWLVFYQIKNSTPVKDSVYVNEKAVQPFLWGVFRSKIILPADLDMASAEAAHIIAHERVHRQRRDNLWRLLGLCTVCLHWFNPLAWVGFSYFIKDMELSCDEAVIKTYSPVQKKEYAGVLLAMAAKAGKPNPAAAAFGESKIKARILNILSYRRLSLIGCGLAVLFFLITGAMLLTNPPMIAGSGEPKFDRENLEPGQEPTMNLGFMRDLADLGFDTGYVPLADIAPHRVTEKQLDENQVERNGIIFEKNQGYEKVAGAGEFISLFLDEKGNYITVGQREQGEGYQDICIVKYDELGKEIQRRTYGGSDFDTVYEAKYNAKMGIVIAGVSQSRDGDFANESNSPFVACIDGETLELKWVYPVQIADSVYYVADDAVFVVHNEGDPYKGSGALKLSVVKLDSQGRKLWHTQPLDQWITSIAQLRDGRIIVVQSFAERSGRRSGAITCYSRWGEELAKITGDCYGPVTPTEDGGFMLLSIRNIKTVPQPLYISSIWYDTETVVCKYDSLGSLEWRKTYDAVQDAIGFDHILPQQDGSVIIGG